MLYDQISNCINSIRIEYSTHAYLVLEGNRTAATEIQEVTNPCNISIVWCHLNVTCHVTVSDIPCLIGSEIDYVLPRTRSNL